VEKGALVSSGQLKGTRYRLVIQEVGRG